MSFSNSHFEIARKIVSSWPKWKRNIGHGLNPMKGKDMLNLKYYSENQYDHLLKEKRTALKDIEQDIEKLEIAIADRNYYIEEQRKKLKNGDVFKTRSGDFFIVRFFDGKLFAMDKNGGEYDNTYTYKTYFPDGEWKRIGNVFDDYKDK